MPRGTPVNGEGTNPLVAKRGQRAAMQATSKVPINHDVVPFWEYPRHWTFTLLWRQKRVDNAGTLGLARLVIIHGKNVSLKL